MINWRVRLKNPVFLIQFLLSIVMPVMSYMGLSGEDITSWRILGTVILDSVKNPYVLTVAIISAWNAINDPTTSGVGDSDLAATYTSPKKG